MSKTVFISYSHKQGEWVWKNLVPCLRAGGAEVRIDIERFRAGKEVIAQMDAEQDASDLSVLVLSPEYLASAMCQHEMQRALASRKFIGVVRADCTLPVPLKKTLYVDLRDYKTEDKWDLLLRACDADLGVSATSWLNTRDEVMRRLMRGDSVNLVAPPKTKWRALIQNLQDILPTLAVVDLQSGATVSRRGLVEEMLAACGSKIHVPFEPYDLAALARELEMRESPVLLALTHFDMVFHRRYNEQDLFAALSDLSTERGKLALLVHSHFPFGQMLGMQVVSLESKKDDSDQPLIRSVDVYEPPAKIFLCYAREDEKKVQVLYKKLKDAGFRPWMDRKDLHPGENWKLAIKHAIKEADLFLPCLSTRSVDKRGVIQEEIKEALELWRQKLDNDIYVIPVRLQECDPPESLSVFQWVDLFDDEGWARLRNAIHESIQRRKSELKNLITTEGAHDKLADLYDTLESDLFTPKKRIVNVPFRAGDPINIQNEAYVLRTGLIEYLEHLFSFGLTYSCLILYGRRRVGRTTLLLNLSNFFRKTTMSIVVSMQDPQAFTSPLNWMNHLTQKLAAALSQPSVLTSAVADLREFMRVLTVYNTHLHQTGKRILLAIDEYENLDRKIGEKVFPENLLATIRESIQTHRNITWIFAGSHEITELKHAEWPSYLVSARTIEVPMFTMAETRLLLTEPLKFSPLFKDESKRPRFEPGFWGENGIERIQHEAGGWPHLVQLIAETIVDVINDADQRQVDDMLFEAALNKAIVSGHNVLYQLLRGECTLPGEWEYLSAFRTKETQPLPGEEAIYVSLRRRLLMEEANGEWRLRVPLMARWLKQRG